MSRYRILIALLVAMTLIASACGESSEGETDQTTAQGTETDDTAAGTDAATDDTTPATTERSETLTVGVMGVPPLGMSAAGNAYGNMNLYFQTVYDGLLRTEPDGTIAPWLATDWSYNDDTTVLTMNLRDDVTFTDGTPFNADAAAQNLIRFRDGTAPTAGFLQLMDDAVAIDDTTLEITLSAPDPGFLDYLGRNASLVQSPATFGAADELTNPIGSGPYILNQDDTVVDSVYTYNANPDYWAPEYVKYDNLVLKVLADPTATLNAIKAGEINAVNILQNDVVPEVEASGWDIHGSEIDWVGLTLVDRDGSMGSPLGDVKVRQAINHAFDREALLNAFESGYGTLTTQVFPVVSPGFDPALDAMYPYDAEKGKALLAEAGYPDGFTIDMPSMSVMGEALFAVITDQFAAIGITLNLTDETADYFTALLTPNYPLYFMQLEESPVDWQNINFQIARTAGWNPSHYGDDTSDELIAAIQMAGEEDRGALLKQLGAHITEQAWFVPFYRKQASFATDAATDVVTQPGNVVPYLFSFSPVG